MPVERPTSKAYADERRGAIDPNRAEVERRMQQLESAHTTHMTAADSFGNVVATMNDQQSVRCEDPDPDLGTVPNNYMNLYDPRPGHALSLAPGKRVTTSMSPMMALRDAVPVTRSACPGKTIFSSAMQALINLIDHGRSSGSGRGAPRVWTEGNALEVEERQAGERLRQTQRNTRVLAVPTVAGGMNGIQFHEDARCRVPPAGARMAHRSASPAGSRDGRQVRAGVTSARRAPSVEEDAYFRTQITRTTDALASDDPPDAVTPCACGNRARYLRVPAPPAPQRWRSAVPPRPPAGAVRFRRICRRRGAAPEKPTPGAGDTLTSLLPPSCAAAALTLLTAEPPPWFCGSAIPVSSSAVFSRRRR